MTKVNTAKRTKHLNYNVWLNVNSALKKKNQCKYSPEAQMDPGLSTISGGEFAELLHCGSAF